MVMPEQIHTLDRDRLQQYKGRVGVEKMRQVDKTLKISIGIGLTDPAERREPCHTRKISI